MTLLLILLATISVGLISLIGILFFVAKTDTTKMTFYFVSLASGTMLGSAFLHLIPEALENHPAHVFPMVCAGVFIFFILEKFLIWRHCHTHRHVADAHRPTAARMVIVGDTVHNFLDGAIIASSFLVSHTVGLSVTAAIILHEIPQELGDFGVLVHGGYSPEASVGAQRADRHERRARRAARVLFFGSATGAANIHGAFGGRRLSLYCARGFDSPTS